MGLALFATSCMEDTGNYDYKNIPDFEISGVDETYSVMLFENLKIVPQLKSSSNDFTAVWFIEKKDTSAGFADVTYADTISHDLVLDIPVKFKPGSYNLFLKVTCNETGVSKYAKTTVSAQTKFSTGYYLLKETSDGNTEIDLHYPEGDVLENVIAQVKGAPLSGKPKTLSYLNSFNYLNEETGVKDINYLLVPLSENEMLSLNMTDLSVARTYEQWFYSAAETYDVKKIHHMNNVGFAFAMFTETGIFSNYQCAPWGMYSVGKYSPQPDIIKGSNDAYSTTPDVCYFSLETYTFDQMNKRIISIDYNAGTTTASFQFPALTETQQPTPVVIEDKVIYMGGIYASTDDIILVCEREDGSRYWYYAGTYSGDFEFNIFNYGDFEEGSAHADATLYANCRRDGNNLYAACNGEVHSINPKTGVSTKLDIPSMPQGEITYMDTMWYRRGSTTLYNHFVIATYNAGEYTVAFYEMIGGEPVKGQEPVKVLKGKGKIKTIQHADPGKNGNLWSSTTYSRHY